MVDCPDWCTLQEDMKGNSFWNAEAVLSNKLRKHCYSSCANVWKLTLQVYFVHSAGDHCPPRLFFDCLRGFMGRVKTFYDGYRWGGGGVAGFNGLWRNSCKTMLQLHQVTCYYITGIKFCTVELQYVSAENFHKIPFSGPLYLFWAGIFII